MENLISATVRGGTLFLCLALVAASACSSGASDTAAPSSGDDGGASGDDDAGSSSSSDGGSSHGDGASTGDSGGHEGDGGGADAAKKSIASSPPAGSTECGHGTFTAGDVTTACAAPSYILDDYMQSDGGFTALPRACNALTTAGGSYEAWCTPTQVYVWVRFDQVDNLGTVKDCHGISLLELDEGAYEGPNYGGNGVMATTYQASGTQIVGTPPGQPQTATISTTVGDTATNGSLAIYLLGQTSFAGGCTTGPFLPTVFAGAHLTWKR